MRPITTALLAFGFLTLLASATSQSTQRELCQNASNYDDVVKFCSAAIQSGKLSGNDLADAYWNRAYWSVSHNPDRAIRDYSEVVRLRPNEADSFYWRGLAYEEKGDYALALKDFNDAIRLRSQEANAKPTKVALDFHHRGEAYFGQGDSDRAIQDYNHALSLNPGDNLTVLQRADAYCSKGDYARAFQDYAEAIELGGSIEGLIVYPDRGICYYAKRDYRNALQDFVHVSAVSENDVSSRMWIYLTRMRLGHPAARSELERDTKGLNLDEWPGPVVKLYLDQLAPQAIAPSARTAANTVPKKTCEAFFHLGMHALLQKQETQALSWFNKAVERRFSCFEATVAQAEARHLSATPR